MVEEHWSNVRLTGLGYIIYGVAYHDGVLACRVLDTGDNGRTRGAESRQVLGVEYTPNATAVELAEFGFAIIARPCVFRGSFLNNLQNIVLPGLVAVLDGLVKTTPASTLVVNRDTSLKPSESLKQSFLQSQAALLTETAVQLNGTFGRGTTVNIKFQVLRRYVSIGSVNVIYELVNLPFVIGEVGIEAAYSDSIVYFERVAGFSGVALKTSYANQCKQHQCFLVNVFVSHYNRYF